MKIREWLVSFSPLWLGVIIVGVGAGITETNEYGGLALQAAGCIFLWETGKRQGRNKE